jgi:hypothetical protein
MKALISPDEPRYSGYRVAWVNKTEVEQQPPLFWVDCEANVVADQFWYDPSDETIKPIPVPEPPVEA